MVERSELEPQGLQTDRAASLEERLRPISDSEISSLVEEIDRTGFAVLKDYVGKADLEKVQDLVRQAVADSAGEYTVFTGRDALKDSALSETVVAKLTSSAKFKSIMQRVYAGGTGKRAPDQAIYQVLRCLSGESGARHNYYFHFDSYVLTILLPILIPEEGLRGDLIMVPNIRRVRPFYALNLVDKVLLENKFAQRFLRMAFERRFIKFKGVRMVPGNLYLFWGYKSLHANEACDPQNIRATSLFHFGDPHASSALRRKMGRVVT